MLGKDEILNLLAQNNYKEFFEALDKYDLNTAKYNNLKDEFISGNTDLDYHNRCKVFANLFFQEKEATINTTQRNLLILIIIVFLLISFVFKKDIVNFLIKPSATITQQAIIKPQQKEAQKWYDKGYESTDHHVQLSCYTKAIELGYEPLYAAYNNRGNTKRALQDYKGAIADLNQSIQLQPDYANAYYNRGITKHYLKDYQGAITDYTQAIQLQPNFAGAYSGRGVTRHELQDYKKAIADYTQAIQLRPDYADTYYNRGVTKDYLQDYKGAITDYNKAIYLAPNHANAYHNRGRVKYALKDYQAAIDDYTQAIYLKPNYEVFYNNRGQTYFILGKYSKAIADWEQMQAVAPLDYKPFFNYIDEAREKVRK